MSTRERGFGLTELLVAMVIAGIIGLALTRLVVSQARFVGMQDAMMRARSGARASLNVLVDELRMVGRGGVVAVHADSITVRVPYAWGMMCFRISGYTVMSLFPTDSAEFFGASPSGYAWRNNVTGLYTHEDGASVIHAAASGFCSPVGITTLATANWAQRYAGVTQDLNTDTTAAMYLYQTLRYAFAPSVTVPGRVALWRTVMASGTREELVVPFDTAAGFQFLTGSRYVAQSAVPAAMDSIRGVRLRLKASSETTPQGRTTPPTFDISVDVYFRNYEP